MRHILFSILLLAVFSVKAQNKTYTQSELDSISKSDNFKSEKRESSDFKIIEQVPVYKGCESESNNSEKKACMSQKIAELFKRHFNTVLPEDSKIESGKIRIFVNFIIDEDGNITKPSARGPSKHLESEALRVLKLVPQLTPGYVREKPVKVPYSLPLVAQVVNSNKASFRYPIFRGCDKKMNNAELKKCSEAKIKNFIKMSFDTGIADVALPLEKSTKFKLNFVINKKGKVEQVNAQANHRAIAIEAINVAKRIPKFKAAGTKNGKPVNTPFSLLMTIYF